MKNESNDIPVDIIQKLKSDFPILATFTKALELIEYIKNDNLNVGWIQLSRAVILIAEGNLQKMQDIIDNRYYGDPRDVITLMMSIPNSNNHYGLTAFGYQEKK